jgi:hypothetical protein
MTYNRKCCKISVWEELWSAIFKWTETPGPLHFAYEIPGRATNETEKLERQGAWQTHLIGFWKQTCVHCFVSLQMFWRLFGKYIETPSLRNKRKKHCEWCWLIRCTQKRSLLNYTHRNLETRYSVTLRVHRIEIEVHAKTAWQEVTVRLILLYTWPIVRLNYDCY